MSCYILYDASSYGYVVIGCYKVVAYVPRSCVLVVFFYYVFLCLGFVLFPSFAFSYGVACSQQCVFAIRRSFG